MPVKNLSGKWAAPPPARVPGGQPPATCGTDPWPARDRELDTQIIQARLENASPAKRGPAVRSAPLLTATLTATWLVAANCRRTSRLPDLRRRTPTATHGPAGSA